MKKYVCDICGYIYDPDEGDEDNGIPAGTPFDSTMFADWECPLCGAYPAEFSELQQ